MKEIIFLVYQLVSLGTAIFLSFFNGFVFNWWNWTVAIPVNLFLGEIWPIYWGILRWLF